MQTRKIFRNGELYACVGCCLLHEGQVNIYRISEDVAFWRALAEDPNVNLLHTQATGRIKMTTAAIKQTVAQQSLVGLLLASGLTGTPSPNLSLSLASPGNLMSMLQQVD